MLRLRRLALAVGVLLSLSVTAHSEPPVPSAGGSSTKPQAQTTQDKTSTANNIHATNPSAPINENSGALAVTEPAKANDKKGSWYSTSEWWLVMFTGGLVGVTGALAWYTARLYRATVQLGQDAKDSGEANKRQLRAWVGFKEIKNDIIKGTPPNDSHLQFVFSSVCSGGSPAFKVEMYTQSKIVDPATGIPHFEMRQERDTPAGVMLPGGEVGGDLITLSKGELMNIRSGTKNWYVHLVSIYRTLIDPDVERITETCLRVTTAVSPTDIPNTDNYKWVSQNVGLQNQAT